MTTLDMHNILQKARLQIAENWLTNAFKVPYCICWCGCWMTWWRQGWQSKIYKRLRFPLTAFQGLFDSFTKWLSPKMGRLSDLCWQPEIKFSRGFVFPFLFAEFEKKSLICWVNLRIFYTRSCTALCAADLGSSGQDTFRAGIFWGLPTSCKLP